MERCENNIVATMTKKTEGEHLKDLFEVADKMFTVGTKENEILKTLIKKYPSVFSSGDDPPGVTPFYYHTIQVDSLPKPKKPYPIPACFHDRVQKQIKEMVEHGTIRPSRSPIHSPLVPVVKKDGKIRLSVDFRNLNTHIINDSFPCPT